VTSLARAAADWAAQSAGARKDAIHFFRDEAKQSREWASEPDQPPRERKRHLADAAAMDAAVELLIVAQRAAKLNGQRRR
jgi:hypothetical protein